MIPLRDSVRSRRFPVVNVLLIAASVAVFLYELSLGDKQLAVFTSTWGFTPASLFGGGPPGGPPGAGVPPAGPPWGAGPPAYGVAVASPWLTLVTSIFIHGGWTHLLGNMLFLWVFGDNVEDRLGRFRYLVFYLAVGVAAGLAHGLANPGSVVPVVGASGAIAGVLGAYFVAFPRARVTSLIILGVFITVARVPAVFFLIVWFGLQLLMGVTSYGAAGQVVAWWAHVGGFVAGAVLYFLLGGTRTARMV